MNILVNDLPTKINVGGTEFELNTDFRAAVEFERRMEKGSENFLKLLLPFFPNRLPDNIEGAFIAVLWFYHGGEETPKTEKTDNKRAFSYEVDAETIYADFWRFYNIDLTTAMMHWWKFRALLFGLPEESAFKQRIYYRTCNLKDLPKRERQRITKIRKQIEIKTETVDKITLEERNNKMLMYVQKRTTEAKSEVK